MPDDFDKASDLEQMQRDLALRNASSAREKEKSRLFALMCRQAPNHCLYCEELIDGYESAFCAPDIELDWSCRAEHEKERKAKESGRVRRVWDE